VVYLFLGRKKKFLKEKLLYSRFSLFERKDAAKEAKKRAVLSLVLVRRKGANRSPTTVSRRNHAIGHGVQTRYVALALRASVPKTEISSTRRTLPTSRRELGFCRKYHATLGPQSSQNLLTARRFILNSLAVQKPH
jgi:hypothetical protein